MLFCVQDILEIIEFVFFMFCILLENFVGVLSIVFVVLVYVVVFVFGLNVVLLEFLFQVRQDYMLYLLWMGLLIIVSFSKYIYKCGNILLFVGYICFGC